MRCDRSPGWRLALRQAVWNQVPPSDRKGTPGGLGRRIGA